VFQQFPPRRDERLKQVQANGTSKRIANKAGWTHELLRLPRMRDSGSSDRVD
jgi:hypothetical protein